MNRKSLIALLAAIGVSFIAVVLLSRGMRVKRVDFSRHFDDIILPKGCVADAYVMKGKDLYIWGKIQMPREQFANFCKPIDWRSTCLTNR